MPRKRSNRHTVDTTSNDPDLTDPDPTDPGAPRPPQRNAANARERARMRVLSRAFCRLKTTLPWVPADTKLSKLDTLRLATSYIAHLRAVLMDQPVGGEGGNVKHPLSLTWPFSFQQSTPVTNSSCESAGCWTNSSRDSEDEEFQNAIQQNTIISNNDNIVKEYAPYYQHYTDNLMHIG